MKVKTIIDAITSKQTKNAEPVEGFTGGDWIIEERNGKIFIEAIGNDDAETWQVEICQLHGIEKIDRADAALIAESKNMYYALKKAYEYRKQTHFGADLLLLELEEILNRINKVNQ